MFLRRCAAQTQTRHPSPHLRLKPGATDPAALRAAVSRDTLRRRFTRYAAPPFNVTLRAAVQRDASRREAAKDR